MNEIKNKIKNQFNFHLSNDALNKLSDIYLELKNYEIEEQKLLHYIKEIVNEMKTEFVD